MQNSLGKRSTKILASSIIASNCAKECRFVMCILLFSSRYWRKLKFLKYLNYAVKLLSRNSVETYVSGVAQFVFHHPPHYLLSGLRRNLRSLYWKKNDGIWSWIMKYMALRNFKSGQLTFLHFRQFVIRQKYYTMVSRKNKSEWKIQ